jgi:hypothetical protein
MKTIEKIIAYFEQNKDTFNAAIEELDSYSGYLGDDRCWEMEMLNDIYSSTEPEEILRRAFYGHDEDTWTTDNSGNREYGQFNPNRDYFRFNGYGNLVSTDYKDYSDQLGMYVIAEMLEHRQYIDAIEEEEELKVLFDMLEEE